VEEGEVVVGFAVAAGRDSASCFEPGVGAFDGPAVSCEWVGGLEASFLSAPDFAGRGAGRDRLPGSAGFADPRLDLQLAERFFEFASGVSTVGPQLAGMQTLACQHLDQGQQVAAFVLVAG
jgi:hypothetical protein